MIGRIKKVLKKIIFFNILIAFFSKIKNKFETLVFIFLIKKYKNLDKKGVILELKAAILNSKSYAVAKLGTTEQQILYYDIILNEPQKKENLADFEKQLFESFTRNAGVFPSSREFILDYAKYFADCSINLDCLGLFYHRREISILKRYNFKNNTTFYMNQEPDRSSPNNDLLCYLPFFNDKKILIICPFADFIKERANKEIFENVWKKTGKKWFYPKIVESLEFPYGLSYSTQKKYENAFNLINAIEEKIKQIDFDIALIAAGGIAIPLTSYVKSIGKIGISLGGHLQVLFGVLGGRWRNNKEWQEKYINEYWVNVPEKYVPKEGKECENNCYW
ncbi:MAG TPA: hypothetical protein PLO89_04710 [Spirochaetota bacterium]|nr:hypothetical protein [Spirochaetota bacterium]